MKIYLLFIFFSVVSVDIENRHSIIFLYNNTLQNDYFGESAQCDKKKTNEVLKILKSDLKGDLKVDGTVYTTKGITAMGIIVARGLKIAEGGMLINGDVNVNTMGSGCITIGNSINGKQITMITDSNSDIILKSNTIRIHSSDLKIPQAGVTIPVVIDNQGQLKTLYSTKKMKKNIIPLIFEIDDIDFLSVYSFTYTKESGLSGGIEWGFIAEELIGTPLEEAVIKDQNNEPLNINDRKIIAFLVVQMKNMNKKIKFLEDKIMEYEERIKNISYDDLFEL